MTQTLPLHKNIWESTLNWVPSEQFTTELQKLYEIFLRENNVLNVTRILEPEDFWEKHIWDSIANSIFALTEKEKTYRIIDIGTGGGFPGFPLTLLGNYCEGFQTEVLMVDSIAKKIQFINNTIQEMGLKNSNAISGRAEILGHEADLRESFDIATIRAVGPAHTCLEYTLPFLKVGGEALIYRGTYKEDEQETIERVAGRLGGQFKEIRKETTPITKGERNCFVISKVKGTSPKYPRKNAGRKPL